MNSFEQQIKDLIVEANNQLEAHNFEEADKICKKAAILDYNNPNIYLIQLLAEYEVTEIEDLQNCNVDFNSENYKKVRRYADPELNKELDKYLINNYTDKSVQNNNQDQSFTEYSSNTDYLNNTEIIEPENNNFTDEYDPNNNQDQSFTEYNSNTDYLNNTEIIESENNNFTNEYDLNNNQDQSFTEYSSNTDYLNNTEIIEPERNNYTENYTKTYNKNLNPIEYIFYNIFLFNKKIVEPEKIQLNKKNSYASITTLVTFVSFSLLIIFFPIFLINFLADGKIFDFIYLAILASSFFFALSKVYKKEVYSIPNQENKLSSFIHLGIHSFISIMGYMVINFFLLFSIGSILDDEGTLTFIGLILGILVTLLIPFLYKQVYAFVKTFNLLAHDLFKKE